MNADFPRILTLLRKERKISQKQVAAELGISQGLLSHYEKGIRECGLDFLVRCAAFYGVSCDYLLGRSPDRTGMTLTVNDIPDPEAAGKDNAIRGSILPTLNKKLISNSLNVLFDLLAKTGHPQLIGEVSSFLMLSVYRMFRVVYMANPKNQPGMFTVPRPLSLSFADAAMNTCEAKAAAITGGNAQSCALEPIQEPETMHITTELIAREYPLYASSLFNLIQSSETKIGYGKAQK